MLIGAGDPWNSKENEERPYSIALAAFIVSEAFLAKEKLNWNPEILLKEGLIKTIAYFEKITK